MVMRDILYGNLMDEPLGGNAVAGGFQRQRQ